MGLFDSIARARSQKRAKLSLQEAFVIILLGSIYADDFDSEEELLVLRQTIAKSPVFVDSNDSADRTMIRQCKSVLDADGSVMEKAYEVIPERLRPTVFAMANEIVFSDGIIDPAEARFIDDLRERLGVPEGLAQSIVDTFDVLYRSNG